MIGIIFTYMFHSFFSSLLNKILSFSWLWLLLVVVVVVVEVEYNSNWVEVYRVEVYLSRSILTDLRIVVVWMISIFLISLCHGHLFTHWLNSWLLNFNILGRTGIIILTTTYVISDNKIIDRIIPIIILIILISLHFKQIPKLTFGKKFASLRKRRVTLNAKNIDLYC